MKNKFGVNCMQTQFASRHLAPDKSCGMTQNDIDFRFEILFSSFLAI